MPTISTISTISKTRTFPPKGVWFIPPQCFITLDKGHQKPVDHPSPSLSLHLEMLGFLDLIEVILVIFREGEGHPIRLPYPIIISLGGGLYPLFVFLLLSLFPLKSGHVKLEKFWKVSNFHFPFSILVGCYNIPYDGMIMEPYGFVWIQSPKSRMSENLQFGPFLCSWGQTMI